MAKQILVLVTDGQAYHADYSSTDEADDMRRLFGTTIIPTAFTANADPTMVQAEIQRLNPQYDVMFGF